MTATIPTRQRPTTVPLTDADRAQFFGQGFVVLRGLCTDDEVEVLRQRADQIGTDIDAYRQRDRAIRQDLEQKWAATAKQAAIEQGKAAPESTTDMGMENTDPRHRPDPAAFPEVALSEEHARRGPFVYNRRRKPVDPAAREAALAHFDPFNSITSQVQGLADHDPVFRAYAGHPKIVAVLNELLGPNLKMFFDQIFTKPPYNAGGPWNGANRYHQDGFYFFSDDSATCWICLDEVTEENGCFRYVPTTAGYGKFTQFDVLGDGIGIEELRQEVKVTLKPGDCAVHNRYVVHGTGPNESARRRRGWAVHYVRAEARWGDYRNDPDALPYTAIQTPDGLHLRDGRITGNREFRLVSGQAFPSCV
jgi:hypothetical protein